MSLIRSRRLRDLLLVACLGPLTLAFALVATKGCPPDACIAWSAPDGGSKTFTFQRPALPVLPPAAMAEWVTEAIGSRRCPTAVFDWDAWSQDDKLDPVSPSADHSSVSVTLERHLTDCITEKGSFGCIDGGFEGSCVELYAQWTWREACRVSAVAFACPPRYAVSVFAGRSVPATGQPIRQPG